MEFVNPFLGMDPYLEAPDIWLDLHSALAAEIRTTLNTLLPAPYYARLEMRAELGIIFEGGAERRIVPDIMVVTHPIATTIPAPVAVLEETRAAVTDGVEVRVHTDLLAHPFVEIRDAARGHRLVTLVEIVSPPINVRVRTDVRMK